MGSKTYVTNAVKKIEHMFGPLHKERLPMTKGDHPELDMSEELGSSDRELYQMLIGMARWAIQLGRIDIMFAVSALDRFATAPRQGHFDRILKVWGYLKKFPNRAFCINPAIPPEYDDLEDMQFEWVEQYPEACEEIPVTAIPPKGPKVVISCFVDSDHAHDKENRRSVTGFIILINSMPYMWYCKRQGSVEGATYGAELVAMKTSVEHLKGLRIDLRMLGVDIDGPCIVFGDNESVCGHVTEPSATLNKKHLGISFHMIRESVAAGIIDVYNIDGDDNPANPLTKSETQDNLKIIEEMFFFRGD